MAFKLVIDKKLQKLLSQNADGLVSQVRKEFSKRGPLKVKQAVIQDMIKGISPVKGGGKWKKYSDSYRKEIKKNKSKRMKGASPTKRLTPVNLRLTGDLHRSSFAKTVGGLLTSWRMQIGFKSFLADIHNRVGAGKSKAVRRILPTNEGESFNKRITEVLFDQMQKATDTVAKNFSSK